MGFKTARKKCGMTQADLANAIGVDQATVSLWETGKTRPRANLLPELAKILGCTIDELLRGDSTVAPAT